MQATRTGTAPRVKVLAPTAAPTHLRGRAFRVAVLLTVIALLSSFDLALTQAQAARGNFAEANLFAQPSLAAGPTAMTLHKLLLFSMGAAILYRLRAHWQTEAALWLLLLCHLGLIGWWLTYLEHVEYCLGDPAVVTATVRF